MVVVHDNKETKTVKIILDGLSKQFNNCIIVRYSDTYTIKDADTTDAFATLPVASTVIFHIQ